MEIYVIRHGQTDWNAQKRIQGRSDNLLNHVGKKHVEEAAATLPEQIDIIFSSPLKRALETAEIINRRYCVDILIDERLIERNFGVYEGNPMDSLDLDSLRRWTDNTPIVNGETIRDVAKRVFEFLDYVKSQFYGKTILIVAHGHVIRPVIWYFNGLPKKGEEVIIQTGTSEFYSFSI